MIQDHQKHKGYCYVPTLRFEENFLGFLVASSSMNPTFRQNNYPCSKVQGLQRT